MKTLEKRWRSVKLEYPNFSENVEILHFGGIPGMEIIDTATVDGWGICPDAVDGGHGKRRTVTHWRYKDELHRAI